MGQYFAALTNMRSVGVMGDFRTYDYAIALRAVMTADFMTAEAAELPWDVLKKVTNRIVNEVKGVRTLCKAAEQLDKKLIVIGDGPIREELRVKSEESGAPIEFKGQMHWEEFMPILRGARFMVLPAEWSENNPLTVIESQSLGTPVLGARIGGIPELIESPSQSLPNGEGVVPNGMTFTSGDVEDLKEKITAMFEHEFDYDAIAKNAIERYSSEAYYEKLMEYYSPSEIKKLKD